LFFGNVSHQLLIYNKFGVNLKLEHVDPKLLKPNEWNSNVVSSENKKKLETSIDRLGNFKPILVRELSDGTLEIIGGANRRDAEIKRGTQKVPIINLGRIDDTKAKEMGLVDNERYGEDDADLLQKLINELGTMDELSTFLPYAEDEFDSFWSKDSIDLDALDLDEDDELPTESPQPSSSAPTHRISRFKLSIADSEWLSDLIETTQKRNGFTTSDALTNAGDALIHLLKDKL